MCTNGHVLGMCVLGMCTPCVTTHMGGLCAKECRSLVCCSCVVLRFEHTWHFVPLRLILFARAQTRADEAGYAEATRSLQECPGITFGTKFTLFDNKVKLFTAAVPREVRNIQSPGAGLHVHVASGGSDVSMSELQAVLSYTGPSRETYVIAFVRLLQCVPANVCVVRGRCGFAVGDQVALLANERLSRDSVRAKKLGSRDRALDVASEHLAPVTNEAGVHHAIKYAGPYVQYSHDPSRDCSDARYDTVDEIYAVDPATAVKTRVMLVPDRGGKDTLRRRRFWWYRKMFHH